MSEKKDISNAADVKLLVDKFYECVRQDPVLSPVFKQRIPGAEAWPFHLAIMCRFWNMVLFAAPEYRGNPFPKHIGLGIEAIHFDTWINLFTKTVDTFFEGLKAEEA